MRQRYTSEITLTVLGPFLTAATGPDRYGVDKSAHRDHAGRLIIPASHVKGKLRAALKELEPFFETAARPDLDALFGAGSAGQSYEPAPATLHFSDLLCATATQERTRTRVTINRVTGTAKQNLLREVEDPFASNAEVTFIGEVTFSAADAVAAERVTRVIGIGLQWLAAVGSEKGVGFGRVKAVRVGDATPSRGVTAQPAALTCDVLHLRITALEPLLVGGVKNQRTNYVLSRLELSGGLLKGALAAAINEAHGVRPPWQALTQAHAADYPGLKELVTHFSEIRVTHALPALAGQPRPVRRPISTVDCAGKEGDVALMDARHPLVEKISPTYFVDAKRFQTYEGLAEPARSFVTRSAIDEISQRAADGKLYTYQFLAPHTENQEPIEWICNVDFTAIRDATERQAVAAQFAATVEGHLRRLGKLGRKVRVAITGGPAATAAGCRKLLEEGLALVTLQTDAILLSPEEVRALRAGEELHAAYARLWAELSGGALALEDFFAHQGFEGGYAYHRRLGAAERGTQPNRYRPYYLTRAGSVFKLRATDTVRAEAVLARWLAGGLPLPDWAIAEYGGYDRDLWQTCPFVPENGYGEVVVNLEWHWAKALGGSASNEVTHDAFVEG